MLSVYEIRNNLMNYKIVHFPMHNVYFLGEHKLFNTYGEDVGHAILFCGFQNDHFVLLCDTDVVFEEPNHISWTEGGEKHTD